MLSAQSHRGPDDWGALLLGYSREDRPSHDGHVQWQRYDHGRIALGHRRLSILDLSAAGRQPMPSHDERLLVVFNGEIYNYIELREELAAKGISFHTGTDTEVLLECYREWGVGMLPRLDGMFAFALWDHDRRKLLCARDPLSIKPFYYARAGGRFYFASEPRAVLAGLGTSGHMDHAHIAEFLNLGISDFDEGTCYQEVRQLRGGTYLEVGADASVSQPRAYWEPSPASPPPCDDPTPALRDLLELVVKRQIRSDVPVGACLSGGIDSGAVVTNAARLLGDHARSFSALTLCSLGHSDDEADAAQRVAGQAGVSWIEVRPELPDIAAELRHMATNMGEPFTTLSMFAGHQVMKAAGAHGLKVMLNGQGGDEVFLGYPTVVQRIVGHYLRQGRVIPSIRELIGLSQHASIPIPSVLVGNVYRSSALLAGARSIKLMGGYADHGLLAQMRQETLEGMYANKGLHEVQVDGLTRYILPRLLRYEDRNSMAFGVETRVPLLSVGLVETGLALPMEWRVRNGWTKYALRKAVSQDLPPDVVWSRRKIGFGVPQQAWLQAARPKIAEWLAELPATGPINTDEIVRQIDAGLGGSHRLSRALSVALWMRFTGVGG